MGSSLRGAAGSAGGDLFTDGGDDPVHERGHLGRVVALGSELGGPSLPEPIELSDDPVERSYQLGVLSPLGALDRLDVLRAPGPAQRLELLSVLLEEHEEVLRAQLALGD